MKYKQIQIYFITYLTCSLHIFLSLHSSLDTCTYKDSHADTCPYICDLVANNKRGNYNFLIYERGKLLPSHTNSYWWFPWYNGAYIPHWMQCRSVLAIHIMLTKWSGEAWNVFCVSGFCSSEARSIQLVHNWGLNISQIRKSIEGF